MGRGRALAKCNIAIAGQYRDYPYAKVSGWITNLSGSASTAVNDSTTHVVATEKAWKRKDNAVAMALKLNEGGEADIKIVNFDWLEDSVNSKSKKRESPYLWAKAEVGAAKRDAMTKRAEQATQSKGHMSMMAEVFEESTEKFVDPKQAREVEKRIEEERQVRQKIEEEERKEKKEKERKEKAELFGQGAKKARNDIFTENHHIYADETGFRYDVVVTKVDTRHNRNERNAITLYESNAEPHTYACNLQFASTATRLQNNITAALGSPFPPAFHAFKKCFKEKTGVEWDDRISHALERTKKVKRDHGQTTESEDQGSRKGVPVSNESAEEKKKREDEEFEKMPFEYHPPRFGGRGKLPKDKIPVELIRQKNGAIEEWVEEAVMSGANGAGPDETSPEEPIDLSGPDAEKEDLPEEDEEAEVDHFRKLLQDNTNNGDDTTTNAAAAPTAVNEEPSTFDEELTAWINDKFDDTYPFDHTELNKEYLRQTEAEYLSTETFDSAITDQAEPDFQLTTLPQQDFSFNQTDTTAAEPPISFDLPSTVQESFQPGTQDVSETQVAERAQGELEEFMHADGCPAPPLVYDNEPSQQDFISAILGKRRSPAPESSSPKKPKHADDEDEAFALAAEESFDADEAYQFASQFLGADGMPRALLDENDIFGEIGEGIGNGFESEMVDMEQIGRA